MYVYKLYAWYVLLCDVRENEHTWGQCDDEPCVHVAAGVGVKSTRGIAIQ